MFIEVLFFMLCSFFGVLTMGVAFVFFFGTSEEKIM